MKGLRSGQPLNMQSFVYYRLRCILAGDLAKSFVKFGGLVAQFNLLGIVLRLAITESPFVAMEYDRQIHQRVSTLARERYHDAGTVDYASILSIEQPEIVRAIVASTVGFQRPKQPPPQRPPISFPKATNANVAQAAPPGNNTTGTGEQAEPKFGYGRWNRNRKKK